MCTGTAALRSRRRQQRKLGVGARQLEHLQPALRRRARQPHPQARADWMRL